MLGGAYGVVAEARRIKQFERGLVDIGVQGNLSRRRLNSLRQQILGVSDATGIASDKVRDFVGQIVQETGSVPLATGTLKTMGKVAYATGADMRELGSIVVQLSAKAGLTADQFKETFGALATQAQLGSVELKDMAARFPMLLNSMTAFGHKGMDAVKAYGALMQVARRGTVSVEMASIGSVRMMDAIISKRDKIEKALDIKLKKDGAWLQLPEMLKLIFTRMEDVRAAGGKIGKGKKAVEVEKWMNEVFDVRARRVARVFAGQAKAGWGTDVGEYKSFAGLTQVGGTGAIEAMAKKRRQLSPFEGMRRQLNKLRNEIHRKSLPLLVKLAKAAKDALPYATKMLLALIDAVKWMADNWKMLLALWASNKMRVMFARMAAAGGAGAPVAGGGMRAVAGAAGRTGAGAAGTALAARPSGYHVAPGGWGAKGASKTVPGGGWGAKPGMAKAPKAKMSALGKLSAASMFVESAIFGAVASKELGQKFGDEVFDMMDAAGKKLDRYMWDRADEKTRQKMLEEGRGPKSAQKEYRRERISRTYGRRVSRWEKGEGAGLSKRRDALIERVQKLMLSPNATPADKARAEQLLLGMVGEYENAQGKVIKAMGAQGKELSAWQRNAIMEGSQPLIRALAQLGVIITTKYSPDPGKVTGPVGGPSVRGGPRVPGQTDHTRRGAVR
jgi:hypothetical protein